MTQASIRFCIKYTWKLEEWRWMDKQAALHENRFYLRPQPLQIALLTRSILSQRNRRFLKIAQISEWANDCKNFAYFEIIPSKCNVHQIASTYELDDVVIFTICLFWKRGDPVSCTSSKRTLKRSTGKWEACFSYVLLCLVSGLYAY